MSAFSAGFTGAEGSSGALRNKRENNDIESPSALRGIRFPVPYSTWFVRVCVRPSHSARVALVSIRMASYAAAGSPDYPYPATSL